MTSLGRPKVLVLAITKTSARPWWLGHLERDSLQCDLQYYPVVVPTGPPKRLLSRQFMWLFRECVLALWRARRSRIDYLLTVECDWSSFIVAALQTVMVWRRPRHVIVQFIMREETGDLRSRLKYAVMRWCFKSVHLCVCSSRRECDYYARAFRWPERKLAFVTILTDPQWLTFANQRAEPFMVSAGRTFRDYATLLQAFDDSGPNLVIVTSKSSLAGLSVPPHVTVFYDLPLKELGELLARSMAVIVPLEDRPISIGQSVVLQAMAMGKPVIVTAVNGTVDYITHMETGLLVPPGDALALRDEAHRLAADERLRQRLGDAAIRQVRERHMPQQYAQAISSALAQSRRHTRRASS